MEPISIATYHSTKDPTPHVYGGLTWEGFVVGLGDPKPFLHKDDAPMWAPHTLLPGTTCAKANITSVTICVLDLDSGWTVGEVTEHVATLPCPFALYSSFSFKGDINDPHSPFKGRLIMPLSRPALPSEWDGLWAHLNAKYAKGKSDPACKDPSRRYYVPSFLEGGPRPIAIAIVPKTPEQVLAERRAAIEEMLARQAAKPVPQG